MNAIGEADKWKMVKFDKAKRERLRKAYKAAVKNDKPTFIFDGNEYLAQYAKYLIEYLDLKL